MSHPPSHDPQRPPPWQSGGPSWSSPVATTGPSGPATAPARRGRNAALVIAVIVLVVLVAAASTVAVVQSTRLSDERAVSASLETDLEDGEAQIADLQQQLESRPEGSGGADPLGDIGGLLDGGVEGLLGDLEELLGSEDLFAPDGPFGENGPLGDLGSLGDSGSAADTAGCLDGVTDIDDIGGSTLAEQITVAQEVVETLRGLQFPDELDVSILTSAQVQARIGEEIAGEYPAEAADVDRAILSALGAVPADIDLVQTQTDLLGAQVAGFYDPQTQELVVRSDDPDQPLDALGLITLVHELEHALADSVVGLPDLEDGLDDEDGQYAELAVVEGDAVALQTIATAVALSPADLLGALSDPEALADSQAGLDGVPAYIRDSLTFPYLDGARFICDVYADGGWDAVDEVLASPPDTTAAILFGDDANPTTPDHADPPAGFEEVARRTFGAAQLSWLFAAPGGQESLALPDPREAARSWRGGDVTLLRNGDEEAVVLALVDGGGLCESVTSWWEATEPSLTDQVGTVLCVGDQVRVGVAASEDQALAAVGQ